MPQANRAHSHLDVARLIEEAVDGAIAGLFYLYLFLCLQDGLLAGLMQRGEAGILALVMLAIMFTSLFASATVVFFLCAAQEPGN